MRLARIVGLDRDDVVAGAAQHLDRVGEVVLALRVLGAEATQRGREQVAAEAVDRRVDLVDLALLFGGVGVLDDAMRLARPCPARPGRSRPASTVGGEDRGRGVLHAVLGGEPRDRLGAQRAGVAGQDEDVVLGVEVVERADGERDAHRVAGAPRRPVARRTRPAPR